MPHARAPADRGSTDQNSVHPQSSIEEQLRYSRIAQRVAGIANESVSVGAGLYATLDCLCRELHWPVGHVYLQHRRNLDQYIDSGIWWLESEKQYEPLLRAGRGVDSATEPCLVQRVIRERSALAQSEGMPGENPRFRAAQRCGLRSAVAAPILTKDRVSGVIELFTTADDPIDPALLDAIAQVGTQIGRLIERKQFERELTQATHREHRRIGEQLHDTISQQLAGISMLARSLECRLEEEHHPQSQRARAILEGVQDATAQVRALSRGLNPLPVAPDGLEAALNLLVEQTSRDFKVECIFKPSGPIETDDEFTSTELFHIAREAIHNAVKHAGPRTITVQAHRARDVLRISIRDDGCGFDPAADPGSGMGLRTLRHRADLIDAHLTINSRIGEGTSIVCVIARGE